MSRLGRWASAIPFVVVLVAATAGLTLMLLDYWRRGGTLLAGSVMLAGFFRLILPTKIAGVLVVRSRTFDVAFLVLCGALIAGAALTVAGRNG